MKRIIACAGIAALGAVSLQAAYAPGLSSTEASKPWSVGLSLRGFYDSNYNNRPSQAPAGQSTAQDSFGFDVSPRFSLNFPMESTLASLDYIYGFRYFGSRPDSKDDQSHQVNAKLDHSFSENYKVDIKDSFVVAQEPDIIDNSGGQTMFYRADGSNFRNNAAIMFHGEFTRQLGAEVGYANTILDYEQAGNDSYSALLDRMEHLATFNLRWRALEQTVAIFGYQYGVIDHTSKNTISFNGVARPADIRDSTSHFFYVGADQNFTPTINGSVRVGAQYVEYPNHGYDKTISSSSWSPYADANVSWTYTQGSSLQVGIRNAHNQTDVMSLDTEATTMYAVLTHQFTAKFTGSLLGTYQHAAFNQGVFDGKADEYFSLGLNLAYQINQYLAAETGYNFDRLDSDLVFPTGARSFSRSRVYLGLRASY